MDCGDLGGGGLDCGVGSRRPEGRATWRRRPGAVVTA